MPATHTHQSRQPSRVVGSIRSAMSTIYAMAGTFFSGNETSRFGERAVFGARQCAGFDISIRGQAT